MENKEETKLQSDLERVRDWAKCGIYHNHGHNESKANDYIKILDSVISQFKSQLPIEQKAFSIEDMREACRNQRDLCFDAYWDYSCNNTHDEDGFRDAIKEAKEPEFKSQPLPIEGVERGQEIEKFMQWYYGAPRPNGSMECEYLNILNLLKSFSEWLATRKGSISGE